MTTPVPARRLWKRGLLATAIGATLNLGVAVTAAAALDAPDFAALQPGPVLTATIVSMIAGTGVFVVLQGRVDNPKRVFTVLALGASLLSLAAPISLAQDTSGQFGDVTSAMAMSLIPLHLIPAIVLVLALTSSLKENPS
jgi:Family of unknown function (DUF6069)